MRPALLLALLFAVPTYAQLPLGPVPVPPENPQSPAKIALGKALFWDEQLSLTGTVACGTCHRPAAGGSDPRTPLGGWGTVHPGPNGLFGGIDDIHASAGVPSHGADGLYQVAPLFGVGPQVGRRKSPTVTSAAYVPQLFWDGRAGSSFIDPISGLLLIPQGGALESQALAPLLDTSEMGHVDNTMAGIAHRLQNIRPLALAVEIPAALAAWIGQRDYPALFAEVFGSAEVTPARIAYALASYQRELNATQIPFDRELAGIPTLTPDERAGRQIFEQLECSICHADALHSDNSFRYIGVRPVDDDLGRFSQTGDPQDRGRFRVPSLRNIGLRAPYMHNGRLATLELVIDFYMRAGDFNAPNKDPLIRPRSITPQEKLSLLAYLRGALTDPRIAAEQPPFDRPTLFTESERVPAIVGNGVTGSNGVPKIAALEPPLAGNRRFTVNVSKARVGAAATLVVGYTDPGVQAVVPVGDFAQVNTTIQSGNLFSGGHASVQLDFSQNPNLSGQTLYGRFYIQDPNAANGLAITQAFRLTVFGGSDVILRNGFE